MDRIPKVGETVIDGYSPGGKGTWRRKGTVTGVYGKNPTTAYVKWTNCRLSQPMGIRFLIETEQPVPDEETQT